MKIRQLALIAASLFISVATYAQRTVTISGYVTDLSSGENLIGAAVIASSDAKKGCSTNEFGFYTLTIAPGTYTLSYDYIGYSTKNSEITVTRDTTVNVALEQSASIVESIVVARKDAGIHATGMSSTEIPIGNILKAPTFLGESDIIKYLQLMPGVQAGTEGTSSLMVRGGGPDENLIMLDGIPVYNIDHVLGIFSIFTPEAIKKVTLFKGGFPARYGGRVSSVIDIRTNDGNMNRHSGVVSLGTLTSRIHTEGPLKKGTSAYSLSLRGMYTLLYQPIMKLLLKDEPAGNFYFYDLNAKYSHKFSDRDRLYLSVYNGHDMLDAHFNEDGDGNDYSDDYGDYDGDSGNIYEKQNSATNLKWGNTIAAARWNHVFSGRLFSNATVAWNNYSMNINNEFYERLTSDGNRLENKSKVRYKSGISDIYGKFDFDYTPNTANLVKFGAEYMFHSFSPETSDIKMEQLINGVPAGDIGTGQKSGRVMNGHEFSLYAEDDIRLLDWLSINPGVRLTLFATDGKAYFSPQPRLSAKAGFGEGFSVKAGYSRMSQYVHLLASMDISLPSDLWVPITRRIKPVIGDQVSVGGYYTGLNGWEFSVEGYYKKTQNVLEYKDGMIVAGSSLNWDDKVATGEGRSYGVEFMVQKTIGKTTGHLSYTLAKSERIFRDGSINNGKWYPFKYDRRHDISVSVFHEFSKRCDISANWVFYSGGTTTVPTRMTAAVLPNGEVHYVDYTPSKNNYRLPNSHRLSIGVNLHKKRKHGSSTWNFSIYNVYNQMNPNIIYADTDYTEDSSTEGGPSHGKGKIRIGKITLLPIMPSISYTFKF